MSDEKLSLQAGIAFMERCLDAELASQRAVAHSAIDMDDWDKAQEILAKSKEAISRVEVLRGKFAEFKKAASGIAEAPAAPAPAPAVQKPAEPAPAPAPAPAAPTAPAPAAEKPAPAPAAAPAPAKEPAKPFSFAAAIEELIEKHPYAMAVCNAAPNMNNIFTYDEVIAKEDMKKAVQLSNGMWAETAIPEDKARLITDALRKYCESRKQQG